MVEYHGQWAGGMYYRMESTASLRGHLLAFFLRWKNISSQPCLEPQTCVALAIGHSTLVFSCQVLTCLSNQSLLPFHLCRIRFVLISVFHSEEHMFLCTPLVEYLNVHRALFRLDKSCTCNTLLTTVKNLKELTRTLTAIRGTYQTYT